MDEVRALEYSDKKLKILDQTLLPAQTAYRTIETVEDIFDAIRTLQVRGAPAIGICAAYGLVLAAHAAPASDYDAFMAALQKDAEYIAASRPTAVNLFWAIERMTAVAAGLKGRPVPEIIDALENEARLIEQEDVAINRAIGENLLGLLRDGDTVLTHCNAGILATAGYGTALSPVYLAKERGMNIRVYADETRPLLQGSRLTAYELLKNGIDVTLICDSMAATVMSKGIIDAVIVGCDRVAANGDTANKIGTLGLSILARHFGIPMYIAAPTPTIDMACPTGSDIPIEERERDEIICKDGIWTAPRDIKVFNPAFDVTPWENITAIATEKGIARAPYAESLKALF
ncbi:MAG: S-methyl-5-thioribose-1-phosphate isomerase [Bacillota bacterium]